MGITQIEAPSGVKVVLPRSLGHLKVVKENGKTETLAVVCGKKTPR
jgi:hypothetical protein